MQTFSFKESKFVALEWVNISLFDKKSVSIISDCRGTLRSSECRD